MKRLLALLCGAAVSVPAMAADWKFYLEYKDYAAYYDRASIRKSGGTSRMWTLRDHRESIDVGGLRHRSVKSLIEYDCVERRMAALQVILYSESFGTGSVVSSTSFDDRRWRHIAPDTIADHALNIACGKK